MLEFNQAKTGLLATPRQITRYFKHKLFSFCEQANLERALEDKLEGLDSVQTESLVSQILLEDISRAGERIFVLQANEQVHFIWRAHNLRF